MKAHAPSQPRRRVGDWSRYYRIVCERPSSFLAESALRRVGTRGRALDLGAGAMNDSRRFLQEGFGAVTAVDASHDALPYASGLASAYPGRFRFEECLFTGFRFEPESYDLVHSNFGLCYAPRSELGEVVAAAKLSLRPGGVLSCTLFGQGDGWRSTMPELAYLDELEVLALFEGMDGVEVVGVSHDAGLYDRTPKSWHYYRVVARKR